MCIGCPDFVDYCGEGACRGPEFLPDGSRNRYSLLRKFYLGSPAFCEHLTAKHGTSVPAEAARILRDPQPDGQDEAAPVGR